MKRVIPVLATLFLAFAAAPMVRANGNLEADLKTILRDKSLGKAEVGIEVMRLGAAGEKDVVVFRHNADIPLIPASNLKLVTTSAALATLGSDFKYRTLLLKHNNDLILIGDGDPTLGDSGLLKKSQTSSTAMFKSWAQALKKHNITAFDRLIIDDSVFDQEMLHPRWPANQILKHYSAQVAGLNFNANCIDFSLRATATGEVVHYTTNPPTRYATVSNTCVGSSQSSVALSRHPGANRITLTGHSPTTGDPLPITIHDPALFTGTVLAETFAADGIRFANTTPIRDCTIRELLMKQPIAGDPSWTLLAIHEMPLATALARANKDSVNMYAEALCKRVGALASGQSGSWKNGTAAVGAHLLKIGVPAEQFKLDDGSGLSKDNAVSAHALVRILQFNFHEPTRDVFMDSLSQAGRDGTLEHRFPGAYIDLRGRVLGKSGFVNGVRSLSGYLKARDQQWYAFSILINGPDHAGLKTLQEQIIRAIDNSTAQMAGTQ